MRYRPAFLTAAILLSVPLLLAGTCRKAPAPPAAPETPATTQPAAEAPASARAPGEVTEPFKEPAPPAPLPAPEPSVEELNQRRVLRTVYFDYDESALSEEAVGILRENAEWLKGNPTRKVVVEGHCDERGTVEYNLALGARRANAVRDYLAGLGVEGRRMRVVSYGKERPADPSSTPEAWAKNRRADFTIEP